jgi:hypothetical protein
MSDGFYVSDSLKSRVTEEKFVANNAVSNAQKFAASDMVLQVKCGDNILFYDITKLSKIELQINTSVDAMKYFYDKTLPCSLLINENDQVIDQFLVEFKSINKTSSDQYIYTLTINKLHTSGV